MFSGSLIIHNIPNSGNHVSQATIKITDTNIKNYKNKVAEIFKSNDWNITSTRFQKSGSSKLFTFDQMLDTEFIFTTVNAFLIVNI